MRSISLGDRGIPMRVGFEWSRGSCRIRLWDEYGPHFQERREGRLARWNFAVVFLFLKQWDTVRAFPTGVGMNRARPTRSSQPSRVPHGCGDEPELKLGSLDQLIVFPTGVGMNRYRPRLSLSIRRVPHGCGDEPLILNDRTVTQYVFPTGVGMNRSPGGYRCTSACVPHGCGDEPMEDPTRGQGWGCSPRAWG